MTSDPFSAAADAATPSVGAVPERADIDDRYKWDLARIYPDWRAWEDDLAAVAAALPELAGLQGTLARTGRDLLHAVERILAVGRKLEVVQVYASMRSDEDTRIGENIARRGRARTLGTQLSEATSWFRAELLAIPEDDLRRLSAEEPALALYAHHLDTIVRRRDHTLRRDEEALLAAAGHLARGPGQVFSALNNADLQFPEIEDESGEHVRLTKGRYARYLKSSDRRVRRDTFETFLDGYAAVRNTLAATLDAETRAHVFFARSRRYDGALEAALDRNAIPTSVYHALIATVRGNLPVIHRYTDLKRRVLGLDPLREHDLYAPLFPEADFSFTYEEARDLILEGLAPLGREYLDVVREGFDGGWIDVHETAGKRSGAYSSGVYDTSPYILMNWSGELRDTFTLAHEMGHSVHSYLAAHGQPYVYGDYPIFTAEVASTCNEILLMDHLLRRTTDRSRRLYLLDRYLSQINDTVTRQTMFAEFELRIHRLVEDDQTLTADALNDLYLELLGDYWGPGVEFDPPRSGVTWGRIPHFYYDFYVYQYATAYAAATALARGILAGEAGARERYLGLLRSGDSDYPVATLARAGVDMTTPAPCRDVLTQMDELMDRIDSLLEEEER